MLKIADADSRRRTEHGVSRAPAALEQRFSNGDVGALNEVYHDHFAAVCGLLKRKYAARFASDRIEQITLESFARAAKRHAQFAGAKGDLRTWLFTIADHEAARFCRSPQGRGILLERAAAPEELARMTDPYADDPACDDELSELVREALAAIPAEYAEYAQIFWAEACAERESVAGTISAAEKHLTDAAFRQRKHRAKILLREELRRRGAEKYLRDVTKRRLGGYLLLAEKRSSRTENGERRTENGERRTENLNDTAAVDRREPLMVPARRLGHLMWPVHASALSKSDSISHLIGCGLGGRVLVKPSANAC